MKKGPKSEQTKRTTTGTGKQPERTRGKAQVQRPGTLTVHPGTRPITPRVRPVKVKANDRVITRPQPKAKPAPERPDKHVRATWFNHPITITTAGGATLVLMTYVITHKWQMAAAMSIGVLYGAVSIFHGAFTSHD